MKSRSNLGIPLCIGLAMLALFLLSGSQLLNDPDTYWHIGVGRWIIAHRQIPSTDVFSNSVYGVKWIPHEWLSEVLLAGACDLIGWSGVIFLTALAIATALATLAYFIVKWVEPLYALVLIALALLLLAPHLLARPHVLALPFMAVFVGGLVAARERQAAPSLWLLVPMWIWANLHGAFTVGVGFAGYFAGEAWLLDGGKIGRKWFVFFALVLGVCVVTPNGISGLIVLGQYADLGFTMSVIKEWQPPNFQEFQPLEVWLLCFLLLTLGIGIRVPLTRALILVGLIHLALAHARNVDLVALLAPLVLLPSMAPQFYQAINRAYREITIPATAISGLCVVVLLIAVGFAASDHARHNDRISPIAAVAAAKQAGLAGPVFNSYRFGGYLIFAEIPPFIDGRGEMYGDAFLKRSLAAENGDGLVELLSRYNFGWALLDAQAGANRILASMPDWREVYSDEFSAVYARRSLSSNMK